LLYCRTGRLPSTPPRTKNVGKHSGEGPRESVRLSQPGVGKFSVFTSTGLVDTKMIEFKNR
jgi:hypothetical protein